MTIEIISGSAREQSVTVRLAFALENWLKEHTQHSVGLIDCRLKQHQLPPLQQVFKSVDTTPDEFKPLTQRVLQADAFIWVSPEYNGNSSPALKNLIDHYPKQFHKPIGIVTASNGAFGGMRSSQHMILLAAALMGIVSPQLLITPQVDQKFDENGKLIDETFYKSIHNFVAEFLWLAEKIVDK